MTKIWGMVDSARKGIRSRPLTSEILKACPTMKTIKCRKLEPGMWLVCDPATYVIQSVNSLGWGKFSIRVRGIGTAVNTDITVWGGDAVAIAEPTKEEIYEDGIAYHKELASLLEMTGAPLRRQQKRS